jgi:mortality factor 4-like protein 1
MWNSHDLLHKNSLLLLIYFIVMFVFIFPGEKVLCFHGPLIYEAKCLEAEIKDKQIRYYTHYAGWNKR